MHFNKKNELKVGFFIIAPILLLVAFIIVKLGYSFAGSTYDIYLKLANMRSVKEGTAVQIKGYTIGRVVDITPVYEPELSFYAIIRIKEEISIYENCSAIIQNKNVIGDTIIEIRNPEMKLKLLKNNAVIAGSEQINLDVLLEDVHRTLVAFTELAGNASGLAKDNRRNMRLTIKNLSQAIETINKVVNNSDEDLNQTVKSIKNTSKNLEEASQEFKKHPVDFLMK
jgi:ABC-type transporter Mla subunit MlaD